MAANRDEILRKLDENIQMLRWIQRVERMNYNSVGYEKEVEKLEKYKENYDIRDDELLEDIEENGNELFPMIILNNDDEHYNLGKFQGEEVPTWLPAANNDADDVILYKFEQDGRTYYLDRSVVSYDDESGNFADFEETNEVYQIMVNEMNNIEHLLAENPLITAPVIGVVEFRESRERGIDYPFEIEQRFVYDAEHIGISLDEYLMARNARTPLTANDYKKIFCDIYPSLLSLHIMGVIHGNLRARNIFVKHNTDFKITSVNFIDFRHGSLSRVSALQEVDYRSVWSQALGQAGDPPNHLNCLREASWLKRRHAVAAYDAGGVHATAFRATRRRRNQRRRRTARRSTKK